MFVLQAAFCTVGQSSPEKRMEEVVVAVDYRDLPLEDVLLDLESRTQFRFVYSSNYVDIARRITLNREASVADILHILLATDALAFEQRDDQIMIRQVSRAQATARQAEKGGLRGTVRDRDTGELLPGATVIVDGTSNGVVTDLNGAFFLPNVPAGLTAIRVKFIGFDDVVAEIQIPANGTATYDFMMGLGTTQLEEVVISSQQLGQAAAINQQLSSNVIVNVVSKDRIEELPDQNAAETVGRLPGVSVQRENGEGQKVVVRGLSPRFNSITINGERIPSTDAQNRSVDLSMISPDALGGIEVFKSLTPDKDGDAVGGTVNFVIRKAPEGLRGSVRAMPGYNGHVREFGQFRGNFSVSNRILKDRVGIILTGNLQRADRSSDQFEADYESAGENPDGSLRLLTRNINLGARRETRDRFGGSLALDYQFRNGNLLLSTLYGQTNRDELRRRRRYRLGENYLEYDIRDLERNTSLISNTLSGEYKFFQKLDLFWRASDSRTAQKTPFALSTRFRENSAVVGDLLTDPTNPTRLPYAFKNNLNETFFRDSFSDDDRINEVNQTAQADLRYPVRFNEKIGGFLKGGVKIRDNRRERILDRVNTLNNGANEAAASNPEDFLFTPAGNVSILTFLDPTFEAERFMQGRYAFGTGQLLSNQGGLSQQAARDFFAQYREFYRRDERSRVESYEAGEQIRAGYLMTQLDLGKNLLVVGGVRSESTTIDYATEIGRLQRIDDEWLLTGLQDTSASRTYQEWLPMINLRYRLTPWMDVRLAATKTLNRPDFYGLVPYYLEFPEERELRVGNSLLRHTTAWNYDAFVSFFTKDIGLLTIGGFYKELKNIDYNSELVVLDVPQDDPIFGYRKFETLNAPGKTFVRGMEVEWQTNFRYLPKPFDGIVFNTNLALVNSSTQYFENARNPDPDGPLFILESRRGSLVGQNDIIANFSIGYEKGGFSGRISMVHQGAALSQDLGPRAELDVFTEATTRWDLAINQKVSRRLTLSLFVNNITNQPEQAFLGAGRQFPTREEYFGFTSDLGIWYKF